MLLNKLKKINTSTLRIILEWSSPN